MMESMTAITSNVLESLQRQLKQIPNEKQEVKPAWKEIRMQVSEEMPKTRAAMLNECAAMLAYAVKDMLAFPFEVLPSSAAGIAVEMAVVTDPESGLSLRGRRWHDDGREFLGFDICSEGFVGPVPYVGEWLITRPQETK